MASSRSSIVPLLAALAAISAATQARADLLNSNVTISESLSSIPQNAAITLVDLGTAAKSGFVSNHPVIIDNGAATVTFGSASSSPLAGLYSGTTTSVAAAPWIATGPDKGNYFAAEPLDPVTIQFNSQQKYFGLLWGSVDSWNTLSFYDKGTLVESVSGTRIAANANGNQTADGSYIVNFDFTKDTSFDSVVAVSYPHPAFEFDTVAYAPQAVPITPAQIAAAGNLGQTRVVSASPAPALPLGLSPLGLVAMLVGWLRMRRERTA